MTAGTSLALTWGLLLGITLLSWGWSSAGGSPDLRLQTGAVILALAFVKVRLIMRHFMGVHAAPAALRWICDGWLVCTCLALIVTIRVAVPDAS
jgi:hypothetical protein